MKSILLLDDNHDLTCLMQEIFMDLGFTTVTCLTSVAELFALRSSELQFDLVFLDVNLGTNMPSGLDAYDWLVQQGYKGKTIFFTGHARSYPKLQSKLGIPNVKFLEKPASMEQIEEALKNW